MKNPMLLLFAGAFALGQTMTAVAGEMQDPANPEASVPGVRYVPVLSGYEGDASVDRAGDWRELNDLMERIGGPAGQLREQDEPLRDR